MAEQRLIDANKAVETAKEKYSSFIFGLANLIDLKNVLEDCPTVEAKPVVHAHWEHHIQCSECGQVDTTEPNYCPNCGAQMDEKEGL